MQERLYPKVPIDCHLPLQQPTPPMQSFGKRLAWEVSGMPGSLRRIVYMLHLLMIPYRHIYYMAGRTETRQRSSASGGASMIIHQLSFEVHTGRGSVLSQQVRGKACEYLWRIAEGIGAVCGWRAGQPYFSCIPHICGSSRRSTSSRMANFRSKALALSQGKSRIGWPDRTVARKTCAEGKSPDNATRHNQQPTMTSIAIIMQGLTVVWSCAVR